jgi:hypothetical protein
MEKRAMQDNSLDDKEKRIDLLESTHFECTEYEVE